MKPVIMGLDLSWTSTGIAVWKKGRVKHWVVVGTKPKDGNDEYRKDIIARAVIKVAEEYEPWLTCIEDYAWAQHRTIVRPAELMGVIKQELFRHEYLFHVPSISAIKKFATDNGNASKEEMLEAAKEILPECPTHDVADAIHLARWGASNYDRLVRPA